MPLPTPEDAGASTRDPVPDLPGQQRKHPTWPEPISSVMNLQVADCLYEVLSTDGCLIPGSRVLALGRIRSTVSCSIEKNDLPV